MAAQTLSPTSIEAAPFLEREEEIQALSLHIIQHAEHGHPVPGPLLDWYLCREQLLLENGLDMLVPGRRSKEKTMKLRLIGTPTETVANLVEF
jgi:hypothetical protein